MSRPPLPPFTSETAALKVRLAENMWNGQDPEAVSLAYSMDSRWRNRDTFLTGRANIVLFLRSKWERERDYRLIKELWSHSDSRIAVRFVYEYRDAAGQWHRAHGNENWAFDEEGLMTERHASINEQPIADQERLLHWAQGEPRPEGHPGLTELGL